MKATIHSETLTDGSMVYNVVSNGEQVAHPASAEEAQEICERINADTGISDYFTAPMYDGEIAVLAQLLVRYHNSITPEKSSLYGHTMDKALCRDTFSTLFRVGNYEALKKIETHFVK